MARALDYPSLAPDSVALVTDVSVPGTSYQNASYGMGGLGDLSVIGDYFNANNYYLGYVAIGALALLFFTDGSSKKKARQTAKRASLKGAIARESELLKSV